MGPDGDYLTGGQLREALREALARLQQAENQATEIHSRLVHSLEERDSLEARLQQAEEALRDAIDVAVWMSGSPSFGPDGEAHEGWVNKMRPKLEKAMALSQQPAQEQPDAT